MARAAQFPYSLGINLGYRDKLDIKLAAIEYVNFISEVISNRKKNV